MKTRIVTGAILLAALALAIALGGWVCAIICTAAVGVALYEMQHALRSRGHQIVRWPVWACSLLSIPSFVLYNNNLFLALLTFTCLIIIIYVLFHGEPKLEDVLLSIMPLMAVSLPGMCLLAQINAPARWAQVLLLCLSFMVPTIGDTAAYFVGRRYGKRKLIPAVSPNKTVAGALAGLGGSLLTAPLVYAITLLFAPEAALLPWWHFPILGLVGGVAGQAGDLFASLIKRHCGVKDYGNIFPGHGGMMDRLDSVLFMAVLVFLYQSIIW